MTAWVSPMEKTPPEPLEDGETMSWLAHATVERERYLAGDPRAPVRRATDFPRKWHDDLRDDLLLCQSLVEAKGMEMLVLDQSRTDIGLSAVKVFVPGLRHFWARFASGRLYDVPVELGWRDYRLSEDELNPIPMFI